MTGNPSKDITLTIPPAYHAVSGALMGLALIGVMYLNLVAALLAGLLVFQLVHILAAAVRIPHLSNRYMRGIAVAMLTVIVVTALIFAGVGIGFLLRQGPDNLATL